MYEYFLLCAIQAQEFHRRPGHAEMEEARHRPQPRVQRRGIHPLAGADRLRLHGATGVIVQESETPLTFEPLLVTVEEAARRLCVGRTLIYQQVRRGVLLSVRVGRCRRIAVADLERYVEHLREDANRHTFSVPH